MDIQYDKYIPEEYLPDGLDATKDNPARQKVIEGNYMRIKMIVTDLAE